MSEVKVFINLGASGSGKTTKAKELADQTGAVICSADSYFYRNGPYEFDAKKLGVAHRLCYEMAESSLKVGKPVIIDNTNTNAKDRKVYIKLAEQYGVPYEIVEPDTPWRHDIEALMKRNTKGTPREVIERQLTGVLNFLKNSK